MEREITHTEETTTDKPSTDTTTETTTVKPAEGEIEIGKRERPA